MITIVAALSLHPLINRQFSNDCFLQAMVIDWSSSKLLSFQITSHIIRLEVHLLMYRHDIVFIRAYIEYLAVTTTPPVDLTVSWRGVMLMALVLIRLLSVPSHSSIGGLQLKISEQTFNPVLPSSCQSHPVITICRLLNITPGGVGAPGQRHHSLGSWGGWSDRFSAQLLWPSSLLLVFSPLAA